MDAVGATKTCYMDVSDIVGYSDDYVMSTERHAMQHLGGVLKDRGWANLRLGVDLHPKNSQGPRSFKRGSGANANRCDGVGELVSCGEIGSGIGVHAARCADCGANARADLRGV